MSENNALGINPIEDVIADAKAGKLFILVDDQDRENEGDLCIIGEYATPEAVNFMAIHGRGLICLALTRHKADELGLSLMEQRNESRHSTAFTTSIEAREGVTTGISAHDRSHTINVAIKPDATINDITTPGHIFPLVAREGGTLVRAGHTEAIIDIAKAADSNPSGVICEIMNDDGTMARLPDLVGFAASHDLKIGAIVDLIAWRRRNETLVSRISEIIINSEFGGEWRMMVYRNDITGVEHIALLKGDLLSDEPVLVRMHALDMMVDVLAETKQSRSFGELHTAMQMIAEKGRGLIVLLRESKSSSISHLVASRLDVDKNKSSSPELRDYGVGAQILSDLDVNDMVLLTNSRPNIIALEGYGLNISGWQPIFVE
ncbi:MAG: 3,4-dihydroxy-2-butanone-4-phosphate synthase [Alphaproteobacteria bacterium]|nr:3,4-dihydroxy-2-butanone-4-phosphate synthase [Alphaproteobacteria bacterium]